MAVRRAAAVALVNVLLIGALGYALVRLLEAECGSLHVNAIVRLVEISDAVLKISAFGWHELRNLVAWRLVTPEIDDSSADLKSVAAHIALRA